MKKHSDSLLLQKPSSLVLRKPSSTLGITPTHGQLSSMAIRAYTSMMIIAKSQINKDEDRQIFYATLNQINTGIDGNKKSSQLLKKYVLEMLTTVVQWEAPSESDDLLWGACTLVSEVQLVKLNGEVHFQWSYAPSLRQELANPSRYAQINETSLMDLKVVGSYLLYEICARYKDNPTKLTTKQTWEWWYLKLSGQAKTTDVKIEYKIFKRDMLKRSMKAVNDLSEIDIELIEHKVGRKVVALQFKSTRKDVLVLPQNDSAIEERAATLGVSMKDIVTLIKEYGREKCSVAVEKLRVRQERKAEKVNYPGAWVRSVLEEEREKGNPAELAFNPQKIDAPKQVIIENENDQTFNAFFNKVKLEFEALEASAIDDVVAKFTAHLLETQGSNFVIAKLKEGKWDFPPVKPHVLKYYWTAIVGQEWITPLH